MLLFFKLRQLNCKQIMRSMQGSDLKNMHLIMLSGTDSYSSFNGDSPPLLSQNFGVSKPHISLVSNSPSFGRYVWNAGLFCLSQPAIGNTLQITSSRPTNPTNMRDLGRTLFAYKARPCSLVPPLNSSFSLIIHTVPERNKHGLFQRPSWPSAISQVK